MGFAILSVSELNDVLKEILEGALGQIWVEGEVSNVARPASGHIYFTLKDETSQIRAVVFRRGGARREFLAIAPGERVLCRARINLYKPRGEYHLVVETVEPRGVGILQRLFEETKARLAREGLFAETHKQPLPLLPRRVAVITSPTGAVIRDILTISANRFPLTDIVIVPSKVQGTEAPQELLQALRMAERLAGVEVIIFARGGGSLEDLAGFNDEALARAIYGCRIPIVSAVGHETDFTIADFVADRRAPTPSAAAEMVFPDKNALLGALTSLRVRLRQAQHNNLLVWQRQYRHLQEHLKTPARLLDDHRMTIDDRLSRIRRAAASLVAWRRERQRHLSELLGERQPLARILSDKTRLRGIHHSLTSAWQLPQEKRQSRLGATATKLEAINPLTVLRRGYGIVTQAATGTVIRSAGEVLPGDGVRIRLWRGGILARVEEIVEE